MGITTCAYVKVFSFYDKLVLLLLSISTLFAWIAYTCTGWGELVSGAGTGTHFGLWRICSDKDVAQRCESVNGWAKDWYVASQALITFGFLGINAALVLQAMYMFLPSWMGKGEIAMSIVLVCFMTGLLYLLGVIVFGAKFKEDYIDHGDSNASLGDCKLSYSFALSVVALVLEILAGVVMLLSKPKSTELIPEAQAGTCAA